MRDPGIPRIEIVMKQISIRAVFNIMFITAVEIILLFIFAFSVYAVQETGRSDYFIRDGVTESEIYVTDSEGKNVRAHVLVVSSTADVSFKVSTAKYYKNGGSSPEERSAYAAKWSSKRWGFATVEDQVHSYEMATGETVLAAVNGDFYDNGNNGCTYGLLMMEGNLINDSDSEPSFAILKNGERVIMSPGDSIDDVEEAISGLQRLIKNGRKPAGLYDQGWKAIQAIGLTSDKDVVFVTIDGRDLISQGTTIEDLSDMMLQLGCIDAIQLDGGGSSTLLTKRGGEKTIQLRNTASDGIPRPISSALMIVKNNSRDITPKDVYAPDMSDPGTYLIRNEEEKFMYSIAGQWQTGFATVNGISYLFDENGVGMTEDIRISDTIYSYVDGILYACSDDKAGEISIGFCGADAESKGRNLIFAYQYGNEQLNIGKNPLISNGSGKMVNWETISEIPWQDKILFVKSVKVGEGVINIGSNFLYKSRYHFNRNFSSIKPALTSVSLPLSLKTIGYRAFCNQSKLKKITIPRNVTRIKSEAFSFNSGTVHTFKRKAPPVIEKNAFKKSSKAKKYTWKVPKTKKWKSFAKNKKKTKKTGFTGYVVYLK